MEFTTMSLTPIGRMMESAKRGKYAIGYFESWNLESLQGVIDAAEAVRAPVIIGFNGEFLSQRAGGSPAELVLYGILGKTAAAQASVPCGFIFNECAEDAWVEQAITAGFNLVMPADPAATLEDYTRRVARLAALAHGKGVAVEAEIDELPSGSGEHHCGRTSDPQAAADFVAATDVDLLSVSVGNEHIKLDGRAPLDLERLEALRRRVHIPLVLHGGTGIDDESIRAAIGLGVLKVNYGTYIKQRYLEAVRPTLSSTEANPHAIVGGPSSNDIMVIGRRVVREAVLERIEVLGCCGKA
jgi:fructose/tagatose bisphosphate aldolase